MRHVWLTVAVALLVAFAGCTGVNGEDDSTASDENPVTEVDHTEGSDDDLHPVADEAQTPGIPAEEVTDRPPPDGNLSIHHIDVGQADATLLITPTNETILIDTGDWTDDGAAVISYLDERNINRIDHLVATHAHADHIGGHPALIEWAETSGDGIGAAYDSGVPHTTQTYDRYLDAIESYDIDLFTVEEGDRLPLEDDLVNATFLNPPTGDSGDDLHYNSIALVFEFGDIRYLTTGDAEADAETRMIADWGENLTADIYQAGHHGSSTSSTQPFIEEVSPDIAIISSAFDSQYGHPHDEVLERFASNNIETYWTGVHGDIVINTDGETITVETAENVTTDPIELVDEKPNDADDHDDGVDDTDADRVIDGISVAERNVEGVTPAEEYIVLENTGDTAIDLGNWQIRDREDGGQVARGLEPFTFPSGFELGPGEQVTLWTADGSNTDTDLYWGYGVKMWRGAGDVIILKNPDGEHAFRYAYGDQE